MRGLWTITAKELRVYATTPLAWILLALTSFVAGWIFLWRVDTFFALAVRYTDAGAPALLERLNLTDLVLVPLTGFMGSVLLFVVPLLTMRLLAEERASGTFELLFTSPIRPVSIVLGKYLAALAVLTVLCGSLLTFPILLDQLGEGDGGAVGWPTVWCGLLGLWLLGAALLSVGLFFSALTRSQAVAALLTLVFALVMTVVNANAGSLEGTARIVFTWLSTSYHLRRFALGLLDLGSVTYLVSWIVVGLVLAHRAVEAQRWTR